MFLVYREDGTNGNLRNLIVGNGVFYYIKRFLNDKNYNILMVFMVLL